MAIPQAVLTGAHIGGSLIEGIGSLLGGSKAKKAYKRAADLEAYLAVEKQAAIGREEEMFVGQQISSYAAQNVKVNYGSPLDIIEEAQRTFKREQQVVGMVGAERARSLRKTGQAAEFQGQVGFVGALTRLAGKYA